MCLSDIECYRVFGALVWVWRMCLGKVMMVLCFSGAVERLKDVNMFSLSLTTQMNWSRSLKSSLPSYLHCWKSTLILADVDFKERQAHYWFRLQNQSLWLIQGDLLAHKVEPATKSQQSHAYVWSAKYSGNKLNKTQCPSLLLLRSRANLWHVVLFGQQ